MKHSTTFADVKGSLTQIWNLTEKLHSSQGGIAHHRRLLALSKSPCPSHLVLLVAQISPWFVYKSLYLWSSFLDASVMGEVGLHLSPGTHWSWALWVWLSNSMFPLVACASMIGSESGQWVGKVRQTNFHIQRGPLLSLVLLLVIY